jgi:lipid-binding SYLF domain-containing protein
MKITPLILIGAFTLANVTLWAGTGHQDSIDRLHMSSDVLHSIMDAPDKRIPEEVLNGAKCIVVVPHLVKAAFIVAVSTAEGSRRAVPRQAGALLLSSPWAEAARDCRLALKALTSSCWS